MVSKTYIPGQSGAGQTTPLPGDAITHLTPNNPANSTPLANQAITQIGAAGIQAYDALKVSMDSLRSRLDQMAATAGIVNGDILLARQLGAALQQIQADPLLTDASATTRLMFLNSPPNTPAQSEAIRYQQVRLDNLIASLTDDSDLSRVGRAAQQTIKDIDQLSKLTQEPLLTEFRKDLVAVRQVALAPTSIDDVAQVMAVVAKLCDRFDAAATSLEKAALKLQTPLSQNETDYSRILDRLGLSASDALITARAIETAGIRKPEFIETIKILLRSDLASEKIISAAKDLANYQPGALERLKTTTEVNSETTAQPPPATKAVIQLSESQVVAEPSSLSNILNRAKEAISSAYRFLAQPVAAATMAINLVRNTPQGSLSYGQYSAQVTALGYSAESMIFKELAKLLAKWHVIDSTLGQEDFDTNIPAPVGAAVSQSQRPIAGFLTPSDDGDDDTGEQGAGQAAA